MEWSGICEMSDRPWGPPLGFRMPCPLVHTRCSSLKEAFKLSLHLGSGCAGRHDTDRGLLTAFALIIRSSSLNLVLSFSLQNLELFLSSSFLRTQNVVPLHPIELGVEIADLSCEHPVLLLDRLESVRSFRIDAVPLYPIQLRLERFDLRNKYWFFLSDRVELVISQLPTLSPRERVEGRCYQVIGYTSCSALLVSCHKGHRPYGVRSVSDL